MDETTPPEHLNPLQRFGRDIRQVRLARKLTQKHLGRTTGYSEGYVCKVEAGVLLPGPSEKFAKGCDLTFGTGELFAGLLRRIDEGDHPSCVLPFSAGAPGAHTRPFTMLSFAKSPTVLYTDGPQGGKLYDSAPTIALHLDSYDRLRAHALSPGGSLALIKSLVKEYRS